MAKTDIIIHDKKDNVGVVVIDKIDPNQECNCWIMENDETVTIQSKNEIRLGHKIAMIDFKEGDTILKYGHDIGKVVKPIKKGEHVHVQFKRGLGNARHQDPIEPKKGYKNESRKEEIPGQYVNGMFVPSASSQMPDPMFEHLP